MRIISKHPIFYEIYKNIKVKAGFHTGTICGYYISKKSGDTLLWAETELNSWDSFPKEFVEKENIELKEYQGNFDKIFFIVAQKNIKNGFVQIIE
jgi:cytochrome c2